MLYQFRFNENGGELLDDSGRVICQFLPPPGAKWVAGQVDEADQLMYLTKDDGSVGIHNLQGHMLRWK